MAGILNFPVTVVFLHLVIIFSTAISPEASESVGFTLRVIPADSPESPINHGSLTQLERMEKLANISLVRHQILYNPGSTLLNASRNDGFDDEKYITPLTTDAYYYIAELNVGKPPQKVYLAVDTTAGLIWTQCKPCTFGPWGCYLQEPPLFYPKKSASYSRLSCTDRLCPLNRGDMDKIAQS